MFDLPELGAMTWSVVLTEVRPLGARDRSRTRPGKLDNRITRPHTVGVGSMIRRLRSAAAELLPFDEAVGVSGSVGRVLFGGRSVMSLESMGSRPPVCGGVGGSRCGIR
jgi:hypothetical protein